MTFRELTEGDVCICNGEAITKISPVFQNKKYYNARKSDGTLCYIEDDGKNIFTDIEDF